MTEAKLATANPVATYIGQLITILLLLYSFCTVVMVFTFSLFTVTLTLHFSAKKSDFLWPYFPGRFVGHPTFSL